MTNDVSGLPQSPRGREQALALDQLSPSVVQALYHELTGKTETYRQTSRKNFLITFDDLEQLRYRILQQLEHHSHLGVSISVQVEHKDDRKLTYSSWEKFKLYDTSNVSPISELTVTFEFAISVPKVEETLEKARYQRYQVNVALISKIGFDIARFNIPLAKNQVLNFLPSIITNIEYVDFVFARTLMNVVDEWMKALTEAPVSWHFPALQRYSYKFGFIFGNLAVFAGLFAAWSIAINFEVFDPSNLYSLARWALITAGIVIGAHVFGRLLGDFIGDLVESTSPLSCIKINRGDQRRYEEVFGENRTAMYKALWYSGAFFVAVVINVFSGWLARVLHITS